MENRHFEMLKQILNKYSYHFYAYGSRVKGTARELSDLDLCYYDNISDSVVFKIEEEFKESDLPFFVELVGWKDMRKEFQELISQDLVLVS